MGTPAGVVALLALTSVFSCAHTVPEYQPSEKCELAGPATGDPPRAAALDDAEDGDSQILINDGRNGYFYTFVDPDSALVGRSPAKRGPTPILGGVQGSRCAWNLRGKLSDGQIAFVGLGLNMSQPRAAYDASKYAGITFSARRSPGASAGVRVHVPDWNTDPDGAVCRQCFNDFGADITLTESWQTYTLLFDSLTQLPGWGTPRPQRVDSSRLFGIQFRVTDKGAPFDVWIDDLAFVEKTDQRIAWPQRRRIHAVALSRRE